MPVSNQISFNSPMLPTSMHAFRSGIDVQRVSKNLIFLNFIFAQIITDNNINILLNLKQHNKSDPITMKLSLHVKYR